MATFGTIESFNPSIEEWNAYSERFEQYMIANNIKDEKKMVATFVTTISSKTYNVLRDLLAPAKPSEVKLKVLVKTLRDHYEPKPNVIAERFHFHKCEQQEGESVVAYSAALKRDLGWGLNANESHLTPSPSPLESLLAGQVYAN